MYQQNWGIQFVWRKLIPDVLLKKELKSTTVNIGKIGTFSTLRLALFLFKIMYWGLLCITKSAQSSSSDSGRRCCLFLKIVAQYFLILDNEKRAEKDKRDRGASPTVDQILQLVDFTTILMYSIFQANVLTTIKNELKLLYGYRYT